MQEYCGTILLVCVCACVRACVRVYPYYVQPITQHCESRTVRKTLLQSIHAKRNGTVCPSYQDTQSCGQESR